MKSKIFTIGHSNLEPHTFIKRLNNFNVEILVDIRSNPYSKYVPSFNKANIEKLCEKNRIKYLFLGDLLGGKPNDDSVQDNEENINYNILKKKNYFKSGVKTLLNLSTKHVICLMCSEGEPDRCHRGLLIGPVLAKNGINVLHILPNGTAIDNEQLEIKISHGQLSLF